MMGAVIDGIAGLLSADPAPLLPAARIGDRLPSTASDLPAVAVSLAIESTRGTGMRGYLREGNQLVRNTNTIDVAAGPSTFSADLKTLRAAQTPLRKNPASGTVGFSGDDVGITRVTGPDQPASYVYSQRPAAATEFVVDAVRGLILFGAPQTAGAKLEVTFWTMDFREEVTGGHCSGVVTLEIWGGSAPQTATLVRGVESRLLDRAALRQRGFSAVLPAGLNAAANTSYQPASGSAFPVWKQALSYRFHFDFEQGGEASAGGPILKVNVDLTGSVEEQFSTPAGS